MTHPDFLARAELYLGSDRHTAFTQGSRSFATAAQAIRFAFEEAAPVSLHGALLRIGQTEFARDDLKALYDSPAFPLPRKGDIRHSNARRRTTRLRAARRQARSLAATSPVSRREPGKRSAPSSSS